nr:Gfo/Idh/MocA family oxidoreductase [Leifsonia aquatica]
MVAHVVRFFPAYADLLERVASGSVGRPRAVRATRLSAAAPPDGARWLRDEERSGGLVVDFAIHDIDQANALLGAPRAVTALPLRGDGFGAPVAVTIEYADGGIAQVLAVADLPAGTPFQTSLDVVGDVGLDALADAPGDPFEEQARYFLGCVESGVRPRRAPVAAAVDALRVSLAARESLRTGARVILAE